jgi:thiamine-phosphate pyrophosphorylase
MVRTRLCLVAPPARPADFADSLDASLAAGDVASLLFAPANAAEAATVSTIAARYDVAAIAIDTTAFPDLDGVHIDTGPDDVMAARRTLAPDKIVGAGNVRSRHDAMVLGELLPDYVFFGRFDGDDEATIHAKALELASWWAQLFEIPAMVMGGSDVACVADAQSAGIEFVALRNAVWAHPRGPAAAISEANTLLDAEVTA